MPTPIGHALAGIAVAGASRRSRASSRHVAILAACAAAPDLDLVLRLVDGANHHRGAFHSLGAAVLVALATFLLRRGGVDLPRPSSMGAAWASHVVLDYAGIDTSPPFGVMALWPFSDAFHISPVPFFYDIPRSFSAAAIRHNLVAVAMETAILAPLAWLCWGGFRARSGSRPAGRG
jgi:membrane-bound metal-dependent hydrolase YbcI (DUF457 family)